MYTSGREREANRSEATIRKLAASYRAATGGDATDKYAEEIYAKLRAAIVAHKQAYPDFPIEAN